MRLPTRKPEARHLAGRAHQVERPVRAQLDPPGGPLEGIDVDIDANDAWDEEAVPRVRAARSRVAFAVAVTLAALPVLVLDNFPATADTAPTSPARAAEPDDTAANEDEDDGALSVEVDLDPPTRGTVDLDAPTSLITIAPPTVYVATPVTTVTAPPVTTAPPTTAEPRVAPTTTTTTAKVVPTTAPARAAAAPNPDDPATWEALARCESGGNWAANTGNGYYGGLQFSLATWEDLGGTGYPHEAPKATQIDMGKRLQARSGWKAWPGCARKLGWS